MDHGISFFYSNFLGVLMHQSRIFFKYLLMSDTCTEITLGKFLTKLYKINRTFRFRHNSLDLLYWLTLYTLHCTLYIVHFTMYTLQCIPYTVHFTMNTLQCFLYPVHCTLYNVSCTLYTLQCILYTVHFTMYPVHCTLYNVS